MRTRIAALAAVAGFLFLGVALAAPGRAFAWTTARGDLARTGHATGGPIAAGSEIFRVRPGIGKIAPPVVSSASSGPSLLYLGGDNGDLVALDATTGKEIYRVQPGGPIRSAPTLDGGLLLVPAGKRLAALGAETGITRFVATAGADLVGSPVVRNGRAVVADVAGGLLGVRTDDGGIEFQATGLAASTGDLALVDRFAVSLHGIRTVGHDTDTGVERFRFDHAGLSGVAAPLVLGQAIYFPLTTSPGVLAFALSAAQDRAASVVLPGATRVAPALTANTARDLVYLPLERGADVEIAALTATRLEVRFRTRIGARNPGGPPLLPALFVGSELLVPYDRAIFRIDPETGAVRGRFDLPDRVAAPPAAAAGRLYVPLADGSILALGETLDPLGEPRTFLATESGYRVWFDASGWNVMATIAPGGPKLSGVVITHGVSIAKPRAVSGAEASAGNDTLTTPADDRIAFAFDPAVPGTRGFVIPELPGSAPLSFQFDTDPKAPLSSIRIGRSGVAPSASPFDLFAPAEFRAFPGPIKPEPKLVPYPNPCRNGLVFFVYELPDVADLEMSVYDSSGRFIESLEFGRPAARGRVLWDARGRPAGFYVCRLVAHYADDTLQGVTDVKVTLLP